MEKEAIVKRIINYVKRHHDLVTHFITYDEYTDNRIFYYVFRDAVLVVRAYDILKGIKAYLYYDTNYLYNGLDHTFVYDSYKCNERYFFPK